MFKVNKKDTRTTPMAYEQLWQLSNYGNFEYISHLVLVFLLITLSRSMSAGF